MKHQFKFNPLATAIFTLLCGSSISSYADSLDEPSALDNQQLKQSAASTEQPSSKRISSFRS